MDFFNDHRVRQERRRDDSGVAVGGFERRHYAERRLPLVETVRLSNLDWQAYFGTSIKLTEKSEHKIAQETVGLAEIRNR